MLKYLIILFISLPSFSVFSEKDVIIEPKYLNYCSTFKLDQTGPLNKKYCDEIFFKINQILYLSADDVDTKREKIFHDLYQEYFNFNHPTGLILTQNNNRNSIDTRKNLKKLSLSQPTPLFIGGDYCQGFIKKQRVSVVVNSYVNSCQSRVNAAMVKVLGCNSLFGPRIEKPITNFNESNLDSDILKKAKRDIQIYKKFGIILTLKHFPFVPADTDLHHSAFELSIPEQKLEENMFKVFKENLPHDGLIMTTHVLSKNIDPVNIVTFSKSWINLLKNNLATENSLIITDSLDMINKYPPNIVIGGFPYQFGYKIQSEGYFAIRAIVAGHDLLMTRRSLRYQQFLVAELHKASMHNNELGEILRINIDNAYNKVMSFKKKNHKQLTYFPEFSINEQNIIENYYSKISTLREENCREVEIQNVLNKLEVFN